MTPPIIDSHCHIYPDRIARRAAHSTDEFYDILSSAYDGSLSTLLREGGAAGVTHFLVQSVATAPSQVESINRFIADAVKTHPRTLTGLGTLHPDSESVDRDFALLRSLDLRGVKLHPDIQRFAIDDRSCYPIYELCRGVCPILIHTGDYRFDYSAPARLRRVLQDFPGLVVIAAHFGGWSRWDEAMEQLAGAEGLFVDTSSTLPFADDPTVLRLISAFGSERILFGTDYPMWQPEPELLRLGRLVCDSDSLTRILFSNASELFAIET